MRPYRIKLADTAAEREQIHALNYATFVEEIPQHAARPGERLVDRFDAENAYVVAVDATGAVVGMLALRDRRPFSLDHKLANLESFLPPYRSLCEVRLLAVRPSWRHRRVFSDLMLFAARHCIGAGHDLALISGTTRQLRLYSHVGFEPFGPLVGAGEARFQPMYLAAEAFQSRFGGSVIDLAPARPAAASFLTGPVALFAGVQKAIAAPPLSHRAEEFVARLRRVRARLRALTGAARVAVMVGSGTLANDAIAASLAGRNEPGVVLSNGEFGERLVDHARRAGLRFTLMRRPWGEALDTANLATASLSAGARWIWAVHCETSTGVLNDLAALRAASVASGARLCLDAVSTVGTLELSLEGVHLAACTSGKGIGALPGLAIVLADEEPLAAGERVPRYLDLSLWMSADEVPFTQSSNLLAALAAALEAGEVPGRFERTARDAAWLRRELRARGMRVVAPEEMASPGVATVALPAAVRSVEVAADLQREGFEVGSRSNYLVARNWLQVALMGDYDGAALRRLPGAMARAVATRAGERGIADGPVRSGATAWGAILRVNREQGESSWRAQARR